MSDFEDLILRRRLEDSGESAQVFETLRNQNKIFVDNTGILAHKEVRGLAYDQLRVGGTDPKSRPGSETKETSETALQAKPRGRPLAEGQRGSSGETDLAESEVHPVFQNKGPGKGAYRLKPKALEKKASALKPDSPNNARNTTVDFDYDNYHQKIRIQKVE